MLVCPYCSGSLDLKTDLTEGTEIKEGSLTCQKCSRKFPVTKFIPRFVESDKYVDIFGFEWNKFHDVQMDILNNTDESERTFKWKTGWAPEDIKGRLILDVGLGAGRFADIVSRWGGEVVGIDLSFAVDAAYKNIGQRSNVHIIQADLFYLPFKKGIFDSIYSIGVLHHTPDTEKAFKSIVQYIHNKGELVVFLYAYGHYHYFSDIWRKFTVKLPIKIMYYISSIAVPFYYAYKVPLFGKAVQFFLPISNCKKWKGRWLDTFDWYSPKYQWKHTWPEVYRWFEEEGFTDIKLLDEHRESSLTQICMRGKKD